MNKILVLGGKRQIGSRECESYQILANLNYLSRDYSGEQEHETFLREISEEFARFVAEGNIGGQLRVANGFRINEGGELERAGKLETSVFERFEGLLKDNITKFANWEAIVSIESTN